MAPSRGPCVAEKERRVLFPTDFYWPEPPSWPVELCGGDGRMVDICCARQRIHFGHRFRRVKKYVEFLRLTYHALLDRKHYDLFVFWEANGGIPFARLARLFGLKRPKIVLLDLIVVFGGASIVVCSMGLSPMP